MCAERVVVFKAVAAGARKIMAVAVTGGTDDPLPPCGACRQVLAEFNPNMDCLLIGGTGKLKRTSLADLLPEPFLPGHLK
jgi:cytidine deaminase